MWEDTVQVFLSLDNTWSYEEHQNLIATGVHPSSKEMNPTAQMNFEVLPWQFYKM